MKLTHTISTLVILGLLTAMQLFADPPLDQKGHDERVKREKETEKRVQIETKVQRDLDNIRDRARSGGYEGQYDKAVEKNGGPRTKDAVEKSKPHPGAGHTGDNDQPGLTGKEGSH
jgi:hypothetical protein